MFNIKLIREHPEIVKQNLKKKQASMDDFLKVIDLDKRYLKLKQNVESLRNQRNVASSEINELQKQGKNIKEKIKEVKEIPSRIEDIENKIEKIRKELDYYLHRIPNIMHPEVPIGKDSSENKIIKKFGIIQKFNFPVLNHVELGEKLGLFDETLKGGEDAEFFSRIIKQKIPCYFNSRIIIKHIYITVSFIRVIFIL